jgi:hypothetical protein
MEGKRGNEAGTVLGEGSECKEVVGQAKLWVSDQANGGRVGG